MVRRSSATIDDEGLPSCGHRPRCRYSVSCLSCGGRLLVLRNTCLCIPCRNPDGTLQTPSSFLMNGQPLSDASHPLQPLNLFLYLSLVTLSSVGYGDIIPVTPPARMIAALEAVVGQLYLAVFIARLVGLHMSSRQDD